LRLRKTNSSARSPSQQEGRDHRCERAVEVHHRTCNIASRSAKTVDPVRKPLDSEASFIDYLAMKHLTAERLVILFILMWAVAAALFLAQFLR
jgi:hypothetical protein